MYSTTPINISVAFPEICSQEAVQQQRDIARNINSLVVLLTNTIRLQKVNNEGSQVLPWHHSNVFIYNTIICMFTQRYFPLSSMGLTTMKAYKGFQLSLFRRVEIIKHWWGRGKCAFMHACVCACACVKWHQQSANLMPGLPLP